MAAFNFAVPMLPGKTEAWIEAIAEMQGQRWDAYQSLAGIW